MLPVVVKFEITIMLIHGKLAEDGARNSHPSRCIRIPVVQSQAIYRFLTSEEPFPA